MAALTTEDHASTAVAPAPARRRHGVRLVGLLVAPALLLSACTLSGVIGTVTGTVTGLFGMKSDEIATPQFEITNGITIQIVLHAPSAEAGTPFTVFVRCSGGTTLQTTITVKDSGSTSIGQTSLTPGWPAGLDCIVSQQTVQGVKVVSSAISLLSGLAKADFTNA